MIDLYTWTTPNGRKASIMLEELRLPYRVHTVDIGRGEQFEPAFLEISPNNKIPAIVDHDAPGAPLSVFESGAICIYLAEKSGSGLLPSGGPRRARVLAWAMFQVGSVGPMLGQLGHFTRSAPEQVPYAVKRYSDEATRIVMVMEKQLAREPYLAGEYSIADILTYPWLAAHNSGTPDRDRLSARAPAVADWLNRVGARPSVAAGMHVPEFHAES